MSATSTDPAVDRFANLASKVGVVGLGYVGLPLACAIAQTGRAVIGLDVDDQRVDSVRKGESYISDVGSEKLRGLVEGGLLSATTDFALLADVAAVIIAVPTPIDVFRIPRLEHVTAAARRVAENVRLGSLVVLESTTYPGCTEEVIVGALRDAGLEAGRDVLVAYSPERIDPGNAQWPLAQTPKLVSGLNEQSLSAAMALYGTFIERPVAVRDMRTAEFAKLFENIFRVVNIALVNEMSVICDAMGIDPWAVIEACSTKPYGFTPFYPGPGLGGHCVPVDPFYLAWKAREFNVSTEFIELAGRVNAGMPNYVVEKVIERVNQNGKSIRGARVGLLGVAYKKNSADTRESPAIRVAELLLEHQAELSYHDPMVPSLQVEGVELHSEQLTAVYLNSLDCLIVLADHDAIDWDLVQKSQHIVVDTRNALRRSR